MTQHIAPLLIAALLCMTTAAEAQRFIPIPGAYSVADISSDGEVVVGSTGSEVFYWRWRIDPAPTLIGGLWAAGVSDDGQTILGAMTDPISGTGSVAAIWTPSAGWASLGYLSACGNSITSPLDISGDGTAAVGLAWDLGCDAKGFLWTAATGIQYLDSLGNGSNRANTIANDGSRVGGFAQGSFNRTPSLWNADLTGSVYDIDAVGEVWGFNSDGSTAVGEFNGQAFIDTTGAPTLIGSLNGGNWMGRATDISEDGQVVVGMDILQLAKEAWIWTQASGIVGLDDVLTSLGVTGLPPLLLECKALSDDGNIIIGNYDNSSFEFGGFIVELDTHDAWTDLGGGIVGVNGVPQLSGQGTLHPGTLATLDLVNAPPSTLMLAWMSFAPSNIPYFGGTVFTLPFNTQLILPSSPAGTFSASTAWPIGVPSGTDVWFQFVMQDTSVVQGITISNGLKGTTP